MKNAVMCDRKRTLAEIRIRRIRENIVTVRTTKKKFEIFR